MKITCAKDHLAEKLAIAARGASTRAGMQSAAGVLVTAVDAESPVELAATDMELSVRVPLSAEVHEPGRAVLPARLAQEIVRVLPGRDVELEGGDASGRLTIRAGGGEYSLATHPPDDFPRLPAVDHERVFEIDRTTFSSTLDRVGRAASRDESRPVLTGVLVQFEPGRLTMAATDSYRMAVKETSLEDAVPEPLAAIIPGKALTEVQRLIGTTTGPLAIGVEPNAVAFGVDGVWLTTRRIEGQFPNFRQLVPATFEHDIVVPRAEFGEIVRRVGIFARHSAPLRLRFADGEARVSAQTPDVGEARESLPVPFHGEAIEIGFNAEYLRDGVDVVAGEDLRVRLINPLRPALLRGEDDDFWYLLMPIRLS